MRSVGGISIVPCNGATNKGCRQNNKEVQGMREVCYCGHRADLEDRLPIVDGRDQGALRCRECGHVVGQQKVSFFTIRPQKTAQSLETQRESRSAGSSPTRRRLRTFLARHLPHYD